jgi:hypothetical protein
MRAESKHPPQLANIRDPHDGPCSRPALLASLRSSGASPAAAVRLRRSAAGSLKGMPRAALFDSKSSCSLPTSLRLAGSTLKLRVEDRQTAYPRRQDLALVGGNERIALLLHQRADRAFAAEEISAAPSRAPGKLEQLAILNHLGSDVVLELLFHGSITSFPSGNKNARALKPRGADAAPQNGEDGVNDGTLVGRSRSIERRRVRTQAERAKANISIMILDSGQRVKNARTLMRAAPPPWECRRNVLPVRCGPRPRG